MDRLISEQQVIKTIDNLKANFTCYDSVTLDEVASHVKAIPPEDLDLKQSFKDGYGTALNDLEDRFEALLNNNPWYANAISDVLQIINEQRGSD